MKNITININNFMISEEGIFWPGDDKHLPYKITLSRIWDEKTKEELYQQPFSKDYIKTLPVVLQKARILALRLLSGQESEELIVKDSRRTALTDIL